MTTKKRKKKIQPKKLFDEKNIEEHIGKEVKYRDRLKALNVCEDYFIKRCGQVGIEYSHDCTANENTYFDTLNYSNYAGLFMMHPLTFNTSFYQMYDAKADNLESAGHVEWVADNIKKKQAGKYTLGNGKELKQTDFNNFEAVIVLSGSNKFYDHISRAKFSKLCAHYGDRVVIKPHPITTHQILGEVFEHKGKAQMANRHDDLYSIMEKADTIYTTHISETALTGLILGKKISPMDIWINRDKGSFSHINHFLFSEKDPLGTIKSIFASPKSGIVHPEVDADWKKKIDDYIDYIMGQREIQKGHYYE